MAIAIAVKLLIFLILITISSVIGIQVFENVSENSTNIIPTTTNQNNNNNNNNSNSNNGSTNNNGYSDSNNNNNNDLNNRKNVTATTNSESDPIDVQTTGTLSQHNNHNNHRHRDDMAGKNSFLSNIHSTMPIQYPKAPGTDGDSAAKDVRGVNQHHDDSIQYGRTHGLSKFHHQNMSSHNKKRQLFPNKIAEVKSNDRVNNSNSDVINQHLSPSNSHQSTLNFVPSPQFDIFDVHHHHHRDNQTPKYSSPEESGASGISLLGQFKPTQYDSYQNIPISHTESPRWADFPKFPSLENLKKDYPKFDDLTKHYQQTVNQQGGRQNGRHFFYNQHFNRDVTTNSPSPATEFSQYHTVSNTNNYNDFGGSDDGKFIWVPNSLATTTESTDVKHELKNGTGTWKWVSDDDNGGVEPKIMNPISLHPSYYEQIKIYHDIKTHPIIQQDFPYSFDFKGNGGFDGSNNGKGYGQDSSNGNGIADNITALLSQWESVQDGSKDAKEVNTTETPTETPSFGKGNFGLADILFPLMNKGKPSTDSTKQIGHSSWKKVLHFLTAAIPIGLIISSLAPQVVYINANDTGIPPRPNFFQSLKPNYQRSLDATDVLHDESRKMTNPLMDFLQILGENTRHGPVEQNTICEDRVFCEIAVLGGTKDADVLNKMLWKIANETPEPQARRSGLSEIFRVIRENRCHIYECERIQNSFKISKQ